jgi:uncharacterized protein YfaS (alpha-2-macroglobulin family)
MYMQRFFPPVLSIAIVLLIAGWGCNRGGKPADDAPYNPLVDAFTSGVASRFTSVNIVFTSEFDKEKFPEAKLAGLVKISPQVKGAFTAVNNRTLRFVPEPSFDRNTRYDVRVNLGKLYGVKGRWSSFDFSFTTLPLELAVEQTGLEQGVDMINDEADIDMAHNEPGDVASASPGDYYSVIYSIKTPDREDDKVIESLVRISEQARVTWSHALGGTRHTLTVGVKAGEDQGRDIALTVAPNKLGVAEQTLATTYIPARNEFSVYSIKYLENPERCVEVTFTQALNLKQHIEGLAAIEDNDNATVAVEGNRIRLYPDANCRGAREVYLSSSILSADGRRLSAGDADEVVLSVDISPAKPKIEFTGTGNIIPVTTDLIVPFRAVHLRGVVARVIKVNEKNVGQFLQTNDLPGSRYLMQVGKLVARKTIFFDDQSLLNRLSTYAVRLNELINPEPGAIYRLILSAGPDLAASPCDTLDARPTKEAIIAADAAAFKQEAARFDADHSEYYYFGNAFGKKEYYYYDDEDESDPCSEYFYYGLTNEKNILATNLGLAAKAGSSGEMIFMVHNLLTANPENGVRIDVYDYRHQPLGSASTGSDGLARINVSNAQSKPFYAIASQGRQRSYLRVDPGSALSLSSFNVAGAVVQKEIKGFIYGERGVWRPGDTLHLGFMLNDRRGTLPPQHPVSVELFTPQGQSYVRQTVMQGVLGSYAFNLPTDPDAPTGAWNAIVQVGGASFEKRIRIESIKPNRLKIRLDLPAHPIAKDEETAIPLHVEWLNGATARNLKYDIQTLFTKAVTTFEGYDGYCFDDPAKSFDSEEGPLLEGETDSSGNGAASATFDYGNYAPGMLTAHFTTRAYEESGEFSIDAASMPYSPYPAYVGLKSPQPKDADRLATGKDQTFEVVMLSAEGKPKSGLLEAEVWKTRWYWWWDEASTESLADYVNNYDRKLISTVSLKTDAKGRGRFNVNIPDGEWGGYLVKVKDPSGEHSTGLLAYFDSPDYTGPVRSDNGADSPVRLTIRTDKETYAPGEKLAVSFPSPQGSRAVVSVENGSRVVSIREYPCTPAETTLHIDVTPDMEPNAYIYIMLLQPYRHEGNDLPIRMYGVVPFTVSSVDSRLLPQIATSAEYKPEAPYSISVSERQGRSMAYTLAVVDEGLLDLTRFRTPDPWETFNAREALGVSSWDLYNHILGAYGGRIQQIFGIGGDDALNKGPKAVVNRFKPVVRFEGPFLLGKGELNTHAFTMPNYNGRVRVMIVAGNGQSYGYAETSVMVRKPVMLLGSLPRIIGTEEEMVVPATVFATEDNVGAVQVSIACSNNMQVTGPASQEITLSGKGDKTIYFRVRTANRHGAGRVTLSATAKGERSTFETNIEIRSTAQPQIKIDPITLEAGKSWKGSLSLPGVDGTNSLSLEASTMAPINLGRRISELLGYPHGCLEQITSKAFPQLYLNNFAELAPAQQSAAENAVKATLGHYRSYFGNGRLSYWPNTTYVNEWAAVYALHFITEAAAKGYSVPAGIRNAAAASMRKDARNWRASSNSYEAQSDELTQAYRLYVLALSQQAELGAMNRLKERNLHNPASRQLLSSAYALVGRKDVADELGRQTREQSYAYAAYDQTFGSSLRDQAILLQNLALTGKGQEAAEVSRKISARLSSADHLNTQEISFALVALSAYIKRYGAGGELNFSYNINGAKTVATRKNLVTETIFAGGPATAAAEITNNGQSTIFLRFAGEGIPPRGEERASASGVEIAVTYANASGQNVNIARLKQGTDFAAIVTVNNPNAEPLQNLVVSQIFPSGWEILDTRFIERESAAESQDAISYQDIRDDRVYSYINRLEGNSRISFKVKLSAVYAGTFHLPPAYCRAMYNHLVQSNTTGSTVTVEN